MAVEVSNPAWVDDEPDPGESLVAQMSAHGEPVLARWVPPGTVFLDTAVRRVAPGQSVVLYRGDAVVGGAIAASRVSNSWLIS
jgi:tRNA U34 2-thiouridine synthase MnmA/TrmU